MRGQLHRHYRLANYFSTKNLNLVMQAIKQVHCRQQGYARQVYNFKHAQHFAAAHIIELHILTS
jgi:hypothetical protein